MTKTNDVPIKDVVIGVRLNKREKEALDAFCKRNETSISMLIRNRMRDTIHQEEGFYDMD